MNKTKLGLFLAILLGGVVLVEGAWWLKLQQDSQQKTASPLTVDEEKVKQSVSAVLDRKVGKGHYVVSVKSTYSEKAEESQQVTLTPGKVTLNRVVALTPDQVTENAQEPEKPNIPIDARVNGSNPKRDLPGFPLLSMAPNAQNQAKKAQVKAQQLPFKSQKTSTGEVYYSQQVVKTTTPIQLKNLSVYVIVDEKSLKRLNIHPKKLADVLKQAAALNEQSGDVLVLTSYKFSENYFGLRQYFWETQETLDALNLSIWGILGAFVIVLSGALAVMAFRSKRKRLQREMAAKEKKNELEIEKMEEERKQKDHHFSAMCKDLIAFVDKNPSVTANVMAEVAMSPLDSVMTTLSPAKKAGFFLLFLEAETPETAKKVLLELGEDAAKIILKDHQTYSKIDGWVMFSIIEEFYTLLVQKKHMVTGPTIANKLFKNTFGKSIQEQNSLEFSFHFTGSVDDNKLLHFLGQEPLQLSALMFSFMDENRVAALLSALPSTRAVAISKLMVVLDVPSYALLEKLSSALETRLFFQEINADRQEKMLRLSRIIEKIPSSIREQFMQEMETHDKDLVQEIKRMVFTFEDLALLSDEHMAYLLAESGVETVALSVLKCTSGLAQKIMNNVSARIKEAIDETQKVSSTISDQKIEKEQYNLLKLARELALQGKITMKKNETLS